MIIQYCSDLHLEFQENRDFIEKYPLIPSAEILILAGDILPFALINEPWYFIDFISNNYKQVYWLPGNHEYYHSDLQNYTSPLVIKVRENVIILNNQLVVLDGINIIFSTLWSKISKNPSLIEQRMADFHLIDHQGYNLSIPGFNELHDCSVKYIFDLLTQLKGENTIVVSHHLPTFNNYPRKYKGSPLNEAFATELKQDIENHRPAYWIFGHTHYNTSPFKVGNTHMLTNQLGYVRQGEHKSFRRDASISI